VQFVKCCRGCVVNRSLYCGVDKDFCCRVAGISIKIAQERFFRPNEASFVATLSNLGRVQIVKCSRCSRRDCVANMIMEIVMGLKFIGNHSKLQKCVSRTRLDGEWRMLENSHMQYRTDDGGYLNWWETTGTITFQGSNLEAKEELTRAFIAATSARRRLLGEYRGRQFHGRLRTLYPE
jgi:hypothetical protein